MRPAIQSAVASLSKPQLNVMGQTIDTLVSGKETSGTLAICVIDCPAAGIGVPSHLHHEEDETFHVLSGSIRVNVGGIETIVKAGETAFGPRKVVHSWEALEPSQIIVAATPSGLEEMFIELDRLNASAAEIQKVIDVCKRYAIDFV
ncbi:MAG: cupin domain-containing protein [Tepidisphaeraceae bacterium]